MISYKGGSPMKNQLSCKNSEAIQKGIAERRLSAGL